MNEKEEKELVEKLAELEHEQWMKWSKSVGKELERFGGAGKVPLVDSIVLGDIAVRLKRWIELWISYSELSEEMKEHDRVWARKVIEVIKKDMRLMKK